MSQDELVQFLYSYGVIIVIVSAIGALIPTAITRFLMSRMFREEVSFWVLLGITVLVGFLSMLALAYLGLFEDIAEDRMASGPASLLGIAAYIFQIAMFSAFVTNADMEIIPMWKWLVVLITQAILTFVIFFGFGLLFFALTATV